MLSLINFGPYLVVRCSLDETDPSAHPGRLWPDIIIINFSRFSCCRVSFPPPRVHVARLNRHPRISDAGELRKGAKPVSATHVATRQKLSTVDNLFDTPALHKGIGVGD